MTIGFFAPKGTLVRLTCLLLLLGAPAWPQQALPSRPTSLAQLEPFMDGAIHTAMKAHHIAGASVVVASADGTLFSKGYGFADAKARTPILPERTLFRIASVSKLFIATAVMQLVSEGKLDLDTDVNRYLKDMQVPATFPQPITLKHLLTHTAGFEDRSVGGWVRETKDLRPLGRYLKEDLPARVRPPGQLAAYSNHGAALAAHIVEQVSAMSWDDYVEQRILKPLGMSHTSFRQPLPPSLQADAAKGYRPSGRVYPPDFLNLGPAGCGVAAADDIARFMRMHLNFGRLDGTQVLSEATARQMQSVAFRPAPEVNAAAHGFYEMNFNDHHVIGHAGSELGFRSLFMLLPRDGIGLFITFNNDSGEDALGEIFEAFMDHYFPDSQATKVSPNHETQASLQRFAGQYSSLRRAHTTYEKLAALVLSSPVVVAPTEEGKLKIFTPGATGMDWVPTGKLTFREEHGPRRRAFREDGQGRITHLLTGFPGIAYERIGWLDDPAFHFKLGIFWILVMLIAFLGWPAAAWVRWRSGRETDAQRLLPQKVRLLGWIIAGLLLLFLIEFAVVMQDPFQVAFGTPPLLTFSTWQVRIVAILAVFLAVQAAQLWRRRQGLLGSRIGYTVMTLATCASLWQLHFWRILTWPF